VRKYLGVEFGLAGIFMFGACAILFYSKYFGEIGLKPSRRILETLRPRRGLAVKIRFSCRSANRFIIAVLIFLPIHSVSFLGSFRASWWVDDILQEIYTQRELVWSKCFYF
jgi:hypothetical protein